MAHIGNFQARHKFSAVIGSVFCPNNIISYFTLFSYHSLIPCCFVPWRNGIVCSPLDYLPTVLFLRRLPHLDAPVMITSSVSNVNVSVQLGDTTPFALGFLSASAGTVCLSHTELERHAGGRHMLLLQSKTRALFC